MRCSLSATSARRRTSIFWCRNPWIADEFIVDLLFNACGETYASLQPHAVTVDLDGIPIRTLDLAGMLKTKQSERDRDRMDRFALERAIAEQDKAD